jgi:hypothetical protein
MTKKGIVTLTEYSRFRGHFGSVALAQPVDFVTGCRRQIGCLTSKNCQRDNAAMRLDPTFAAGALPIPCGVTAAPSSRAAAFESTIN